MPYIPAQKGEVYGLRKAGRAQLDKELEQWQRLSSAVVLVINAAQEV